MAVGSGKSAGDGFAQVGGAQRQLPLALRPFNVAQFVGRGGELERVEAAFWRDAADAVAIVPASVKAAEGVGKTTIAAEYAARHLARYAGLCWIDARQPASMAHQIIASASRFMPNLGRIRQQASALSRSLDFFIEPIDGRPWLLVLDDAEDVEQTADLIAKCSKRAHVLITSSRPFWPAGIAILPVDVFPTDVAASYLIRRGVMGDAGEASALALQLGYLPLALSQAADYCRLTGCSASTYAAEADRWTREVKLPGIDSPAFATTAMALGQIANLSRGSLSLLETLAVLGANGVRTDWLSGAPDLPGSMTDRPDITDAFERLAEFSLARLAQDDDGRRLVGTHPLVQRVIRQWAGANHTIATALARGHEAIAAQTQRLELSNRGRRRPWAMEASLLPHALALLANGARDEASLTMAKGLSQSIGRMLGQTGAARSIDGSLRGPARWLLVLIVALLIPASVLAWLAIAQPAALERLTQILSALVTR